MAVGDCSAVKKIGKQFKLNVLKIKTEGCHLDKQNHVTEDDFMNQQASLQPMQMISVNRLERVSTAENGSSTERYGFYFGCSHSSLSCPGSTRTNIRTVFNCFAQP